MPRRARVMIGGVPVHIIQRGNNRSVCFFADEDCVRYLDWLEELAAKFKCQVHAYCLMTNHVHLLLTPARAEDCALLMKNLDPRYVQHVDRAYECSGTLWEGRFRSCLLQAEDYVLACYRYIELNPVRANMVRHPREYRWSSYRSYAEGKGSDLLVRHEQYERLGRNDEARREAYRELFRAHVDQEMIDRLRTATNCGYVQSSGRFQSQIAKTLGRRVVPGEAGRPRSKSRQEIKGQSGK